MDRLNQHRALRDRIPRTFDAFFDRFPSFQRIQELAIPALADGANCILLAPTAGGKTEAAVAPLLARILEAAGRDVEGPALLYIVPTRALVNDVYRRLEVPMQRLGLRLGRKTGDHSNLPPEFPQVLITTPESLDSLICRVPRRLLPCRALVLDELHALDGTPRGDQLAACCTRLERITRAGGTKLQVAMASATVDRPEHFASRYATDVQVLRDDGVREMRARMASCPFQKSPHERLASLLAGKPGKVLVFCNSRSDVEWCANQLRGCLPFGERVYAHHGSLARAVRERVERDFAHAKTAVCFATSTLELGIDIGDIDHVALYGVPPDLSSFLQRVGRAGRRESVLSFAALARDPGETLRFKHMTELARKGRLLTDPTIYDPGTALQQAASLLFQNPGAAIAPAHVLDRLPDWQRSYWSEERLEMALASAREQFQRVAQGHYVAGEKLERAYTSGVLHSNIGGEAEVEVVEILTGRSLGTVSRDLLDERGSPSVLLGGSSRSVSHVSGKGRLVVHGAGASSGVAKFEAKAAPPVPHALAEDFLDWLGLEKGPIHRVEAEDDTIFLHGLGTLHGTLLYGAASSLPVLQKPGRSAAFCLQLKRGFQDWPAELGQVERLSAVTREYRRQLTRILGFGPWFALLPDEEREHAVLEAVRPAALSARLRKAEIAEVHDEELRKEIRKLLPAGRADLR